MAKPPRMLWAAAVLVAAVAFACSLSVAAAGKPSVYYMKDTTLGFFLEKPGMTLNVQDAYTTINVKNKCTCRAACWTHTRCVAVAMVPDGETLQCRLADKGPTRTEVTADPNATYTYWENSLPAGTYILGEDTMLYRVVNDKADFKTAKELCSKIPGHRLAITKTIKQYQTLRRISSERKLQLWVDLRREVTTTKNIIWGDNTLYNDSEISGKAEIISNGNELETQYYRLMDGVLHDMTMAKGLYNPLCQADPVDHGA